MQDKWIAKQCLVDFDNGYFGRRTPFANSHLATKPHVIPSPIVTDFYQRLASPVASELLFDHLPDLTYFVKNQNGQYIAVNKTLAERCGASTKEELIGCVSTETFSKPFGHHFLAQDLALIRTGKPLINELEQHPYPHRGTGWCLTTKLPLRDRAGVVIGLVGMSRDLHLPKEDTSDFDSVARVIEIIRRDLDQPLKISHLAESAGLSTWQLDQRMRELFGVTVSQFILQTRMDAAARRLRQGNDSIVQVALAVGYGDQSAFTRQFGKTFGMTPSAYRNKECDDRAATG